MRNFKKLIFTSFCLIIAVNLTSKITAQSVQFESLGFLDHAYNSTRPCNISDDGRYVIGYASFDGVSNITLPSQKIILWDKQYGTRYLNDVIPLNGKYSNHPLMSADGSTFFCYDLKNRYVWNEKNGFQAIQGIALNMSPLNISANGNVVCGRIEITDSTQPGPHGRVSSQTHYEAFVWDSVNGVTDIPMLNDSYRNNHILSMSADGDIVAGTFKTDRSFSLRAVSSGQAYIWTKEHGTQGLGFLSPDHNYSELTCLSDDGSTAVGISYSTTDQDSQPFIWNPSTGMEPLGVLPNTNSCYPNAVSANGQVIIGDCYQSQGIVHPVGDSEAFIWDRQNGMRSLGCLPGYTSSSAKFVSTDGSVVVGTSSYFPQQATGPIPIDQLESDIALIDQLTTESEIFVWRESSGMVSLSNLLTAQGIDINGWSLFQVSGLSADGTVIIGYGGNPDGLTEGWVATIPEPASICMLMIGCLAILPNHRQKTDNKTTP